MDATRDGETSSERRPRRWADLVLALVFAVGIAAPGLGLVVGFDTGRVPGENRPLAAPPQFGAVPFATLPSQIDAWFSDNFGLRNSLVSLHGYVDYALFGVSSTPQVTIGRRGWIFYGTDRIIDSRRGIIPFTVQELAAWQTRLEERRDWVAALGSRYVFVIAPEKSSVYAEYLPARLQPSGAPTRTDQFVAWMREHSTVPVLDLRSALLEAKERERVYHRYDSHWNDVGAFAGYRQIAAWLQTQFPAVRPLEQDQLTRQVVVSASGDLAGILALQPYLAEERTMLVPDELPTLHQRPLTASMEKRATLVPQVGEYAEGEIGTAVVIHDSFFRMIRPFLARHFRRSTFINRAFAPDILTEEKPDVVIEELAERALSRNGFLPERELPEQSHR